MKNSNVAAALAAASDQGATNKQLKQLKQMLMGYNFGPSPTKKVLTRAQRVTRRKMQKESRRVNRGKNQGKRSISMARK